MTKEKKDRMTVKLQEFGEHVIADEDSIQALLLTYAILKELQHINWVKGVSIDDINDLWYHTGYEEPDMIEYVLSERGLLWTPMMQRLIDKTVKALHYISPTEHHYMDGVVRVRELIWDAAQHIDDLCMDTIYHRTFYQMYSNLLGTYRNEMSEEYWQEKECDIDFNDI